MAGARSIAKIPILPIEEMEAVGGKFLSGRVTARSGEMVPICVYTTPTYTILKEDKYQSILIKVGLEKLLNMLPLGVDLQACADFIATYDVTSQIGIFTSAAGQETPVQITQQLVADALQLDLLAPRISPLSLPTLKATGVITEGTKKGFKYNELLNHELAMKMQGFDFLTTWTLVDHVQRVSQTALAYILEEKPCFQYIYSSLIEGLKKKQPILCNPQLLTKILYCVAAMPYCSPTTASLQELRQSKSKLRDIKEIPVGEPIDKVEGQSKQNEGPSGEGMHPGGNESIIPPLETPDQQGEEEYPYEIHEVFQGTLHNRKRQGEASEYFNSLSRKLQHLDIFPGEGSLQRESDPPQSPIELSDALVVTQHLLLRELRERHHIATEEYIKQQIHQVKEEYEEKLREATLQKEQVQQELESAKDEH